MGTVDQAVATEHASGVIKYPRPRLNRMIDNAIGYGHVFVEYRHGGRLQVAMLEAQGHIPSEGRLATLAVSILHRQSGVSPSAVRIVQASGTWQEIPSWTGQWFPTPD